MGLGLAALMPIASGARHAPLSRASLILR